MKKNYYCIIMAGGIGSRFWPMSTVDKPKQFLNLSSEDKSLLRETFDRALKIVDLENIYVVTNDKYKNLIKEDIGVLDKNILCEPFRRNTSNCILYATFRIKKENPNAVLFITPSDHLIGNVDVFNDSIRKLLKYASEKDDRLFTFGIKPKWANTGYGYIEYATVSSFDNNIKKVKNFVEKPPKDKAMEFIKKGNYLWNSGIFIWSIDSFIRAAKKSIPFEFSLFSSGEDLYGTNKEKAFIEDVFSKSTDIPIDRSLMERAQNIYVMESGFKWNDLGSWSSLYETKGKDKNNNLILSNSNNVYLFDSKSNIINGDKDKKIVINGLDELIVVNKNDVIFICPKSREQEIGDIFKLVDKK